MVDLITPQTECLSTEDTEEKQKGTQGIVKSEDGPKTKNSVWFSSVILRGFPLCPLW